MKKGLIVDKGLNDFLKPIFPVDDERHDFIKNCLRKIGTRRMLLRAQWYTEIADDQEKVRQSRPALSLIFLMALAEAIAKNRTRNVHLRSPEAVKEFFKYISEEDKTLLFRGFRRLLISPRHHDLRFSSILKILYNVRNSAVHGEDYFSFSLMDRGEKEKHAGYTDFGLITSGYLGGRREKRRVSLHVKLTYEELRDIFRRTALANIKSLL